MRFVELAEAYEVLSDPEQRALYDRHGYDFLKKRNQGGGGGSGGFHDPFDIFSQFFGGHGHFGGGSGGGGGGVRKGPSMETVLLVGLADIYKGGAVEFTISRKVVCDTCEGSGAFGGPNSGNIVTCSACGGQGVRIVRQQLAPGMFSQMKSQCDVCGGAGKTIKKKCQHCHGAKVVEAVSLQYVDIERGLPRGTKVVFESEADESPDWETGDLVVEIRESSEEPNGWRRKGEDLYRTEVLGIVEALTGDWTRNLTRLDGSNLQITRKPGVVTQPGFVETIVGEGMPKYKSSGLGNLYIEWNIVLPETMSSKNGFVDDLRQLFDNYRTKPKSGWFHNDL